MSNHQEYNLHQLVFLRHGESEWNKKNLFTGWTDVDLSNVGREEIIHASRLLKEQGFIFDLAFTSVLKRAIRTLWIALDEMNLMWIPIIKNWQLNERHYRALQGLNKSETAAQYGEKQVKLWRRSYAVRPPALELKDPRHPCQDPKYKLLLSNQLPDTECLKDTVERVIPYWLETIAPMVKCGRLILIVAHGNTIRALVKHLDHISDSDIADVDIPTGIPLVYELDDELHPIKHYYLEDAEQVKVAMQAVANQASVKK